MTSIFTKPTSLFAGAVGAIALTALHESARRVLHDPPRADRLGEQAVQKGLHAMHLPSPQGAALYRTALVGDLLTNTLFYALIGKGRGVWIRGSVLGAIAGLGAVLLPGVLGLDEEHTADSKRKAVQTFAYYMLGALATAAVSRAIRSDD